TSISTADGGDVAVDYKTLAASGQSIRYSSNQRLGGFRRGVYDSLNIRVQETFIPLNGLPENTSFKFITPVELNKVDPVRLVIGATNGILESFDQGDNVQMLEVLGGGEIFPNDHALAYGGYLNFEAKPDIIYTAQSSTLYIRANAGDPLTPTAYSGGFVRDIVMAARNWRHVYVVDSDGGVYESYDEGATWNNISGNLSGLFASDFRSIEFIEGRSANYLLVGARGGIYVMSDQNVGVWNRLGNNLPRVP